ncbi:MAG TPA: protein kinase [Kofleriaceae bacterium]|jgi:WD40 repeat protein
MPTQAAASPSLVGRQLGEFKLVELLGEGGMGAAYRAEQATLRRAAVVKVMALDDVSEESRVRFLREARLASQLDHPYAAHVYAFGAEPDGLLWIAMELVRGVPLDRMLEEHGPMQLARFVPLFDRLCEVVHSAHEQGIVHRDIKPANIMVVRRAGRLLPKLLDLGVARGSLADPVETGPSGELADTPLEGGTRPITVRGHVVGSPPYMAPEQWYDAARASPRTDLYALAITAYELLTGRRPFDGETVRAIAQAHARAPVPPVGPGLPSALDRVFARALAKREHERYGDVLELANAVREIAQAKTTETDFDEAVRDTFVQGGPQPLAEALLELAGARSPDAAWDAAWKVVTVAVRAMTVIALATRARIVERSLDDKIAARIRVLVERGLDLEEWIELAAAVVESFAASPQAHPVPELVEALWLDGRPRGLFDDLLARRREHAGRIADADIVHAMLAELGRVLRACAFLADHAWVSADGEAWMGPRRHPRERRAILGTATPGLWLIDGDGALVVELSPLARVAPAVPGGDDEVFLIDGPAKRGARAVSWPREFEHHDQELWQFVDTHLARLGDRVAAADREVAPYRGLASFGAADAQMFFGREREVEATINRLRVESLIAVVGPSGVGKSSFVHAGVVPALPETWLALSFRPGASPLTSLEARLGAAGVRADGLAAALQTEPARLATVLAAHAEYRADRVVIVIDQLEEIFTQCRDAATRDAFARALAALADGGTRVFLTLRDDFLVRAAELPGLGPRLAGALELVTLPGPDVLRRILTEPLRQVGYTFENAALPDAMIAELREHPGALALLSFAAAKLWDVRDRRFHHIPQRAYDAIGGVAGALGRHAEETLSALATDDIPLVRELFRHLVTSEGTRATLRRSEALELLGKTASAERVIEALVTSRLLVGYEGADHTESIEVIHEALLTAWPRLVTWQREDAEAARLRDQLRSAARQWGERGRPRGLLWRGEAIVEYKLWRARHEAVLTDLEAAFAAASIADEQRARRIRRFALGAVVAGLAIGVIVLQHANGVAERNAREAERTALASLVEQGRTAAIANRPQEAMAYLSAAYSQGAEDPNLPFLLAMTRRQLGGEGTVMTLPGGGSLVGVTRDGAHIVTASEGDVLQVWSITGALEHTIPNVLSGRDFWLTADGGIAALRTGYVPAVWDLATGALRFELKTANPTSIVVVGGTLVTLEPDRIASWSTRDGTPIAAQPLPRLDPHWFVAAGDRYVYELPSAFAVGRLDLREPPTVVPLGYRTKWLAIDRQGRHLVVARDDSRDAQVWDLEHVSAPPRVLSGHTSEIMLMDVSPDGSRIGTSSTDHTAKIWDTATGRLITSLDGHDGYIRPVKWSPDGRLAATGSVDRTARVWDPTTGATLTTLYGHSDAIADLAFTPGGDKLVTASLDRTARIFDIRPQQRRIELGHIGSLTLRFSGDGHRLLVVGHDHSAWVLDVATGKTIATLDEYRAEMPGTRIDSDLMRACGDIDLHGDRIVIPTGNEARVIQLADRGHPTVLREHAPVSCARFVDGGRVALASGEAALSIWTAAGTRERTQPIGTSRIDSLAFDPISRSIAAGGDDGKVRIVSLDSPIPTAELDVTTEPVRGVAWSHRGDLLATGTEDTMTRVFGSQSWSAQAASRSLSDVEDVAFSPDDLRVAIVDNDGVSVIDSANGRTLAHLGDITGGFLTSVAVSPGGDLLASCDDLGVISFWAIPTETQDPAEVAHYVSCRIPFALAGSRLMPHATTVCR